jgi:hypothetical protein
MGGSGRVGPSGSENGIGSNARFFFCSGVAIAPNRVFALVNNNMIRRIEITLRHHAGGLGVEEVRGSRLGRKLSQEEGVQF